jgi:hypothetical protein
MELHSPLSISTLVYCDNVSVVSLASNPFQHQCTKHVKIDLHFICEKVSIGEVHILHVSMTSQFADLFTKGLLRILDRLKPYAMKWMKELPSVLWDLCMTLSRATGQMPFSLVYDFEAMLPIEVEHKSF